MKFYLAIPLMIALMSSGCRVPDTPHLKGVVVDEANRQPVAGATLHYDGYPKRQVHTAKDGTFDFPPILIWMPMSPLDRSNVYVLFVEAPGYEQMHRSYGSWEDGTNEIFLLKHD